MSLSRRRVMGVPGPSEREAARLRRDLSEALGLLRAHQRATASSGDDPGWQAWDAAVAALLAKYPPKVD